MTKKLFFGGKIKCIDCVRECVCDVVESCVFAILLFDLIAPLFWICKWSIVCEKKNRSARSCFSFLSSQQTILPCCPSDSASGGTRLFFFPSPSFAYIHALYSFVFFPPPMKTELCDCILPHWNRLREKNNNSHIGNEILSYFIWAVHTWSVPVVWDTWKLK